MLHRTWTARRALRATALVVTCLALAACGKVPLLGGSGSGSGSAGNPSQDNFAPAISGQPPTSAVVSQPYSFQPQAYDPEGDRLQFSIVGKPTWAAFDSGTGRLSGTPPPGSGGNYGGIRIAVTDGSATTYLPDFSILVAETAAGSFDGTAELSWTAPAKNVDGTSLQDLAGYRIYYGQSPDNLSQVLEIASAGTLSAVIPNLSRGTWYFAVTAYSQSGIESKRTYLAWVTL